MNIISWLQIIWTFYIVSFYKYLECKSVQWDFVLQIITIIHVTNDTILFLYCLLRHIIVTYFHKKCVYATIMFIDLITLWNKCEKTFCLCLIWIMQCVFAKFTLQYICTINRKYHIHRHWNLVQSYIFYFIYSKSQFTLIFSCFIHFSTRNAIVTYMN